MDDVMSLRPLKPGARASTSQDMYPKRLSLGVMFRRLHVYGFMSSARFQPSVPSALLYLPRLVKRIFSKSSRRKVQILYDIDGVVQAGEMLLVLGRPGSGCTTFLKALSGDTHGIFIEDQSVINYEGIGYDEMHAGFKGESIYLAELDDHLPELTLGQTLKFAASTREPGSGRRDISERVANDTSESLGLKNAFDTWMGNSTIRGVSGGERRRASLAEAIIGKAQLQCWDNSTRGLDSATAQRFIDLLRNSTNLLGTTVAMTIYQAPETMYECFDRVTLLYEGRQIYFGPANAATQYFHDLGFQRPGRATSADFLTSLTNPDERLVRAGYEDKVPRTPDDFAKVWQMSPLASVLYKEIDHFGQVHPISPANDKMMGDDKYGLRIATYAIPIYLQILICLQRGFRRLRNDPATATSMAIANGILALVLSSAFYNMSATADSMDRRSTLIFFSLMITGFVPAFEVLLIWAQRPVVEKHNRYAFYHPFADAAASMICDLPNKLATAILFQATVYFMANLRRTAAAFFTWLLFNFVLMLAMSAWFRLLGSVSRKREHTMAPSGVITCLCVIYIGFVVPVPYMVTWLAWFRFVNPISYAFESLMINEFHEREFTCVRTVPEGPSYNTAGLDGKICSQIGARAGEAFVQGTEYIRYKYDYQHDHLWRNLIILLCMTVGVVGLHLLTSHYIPAERSKGDVLRFKRDKSSMSMGTGDSECSSILFAQDINREPERAKLQDHSDSQTERIDNGIQHQESVFHWRNLSYDVKTGKSYKNILKNVDGWVKPGTLTALMGVTGAGKTTLLDVLAKRVKTGIVTGDIFVDGQPRDTSFQYRMGYVQQEDIHVPTATVREALEFSAMIRQPNTKSSAKKREYVERIINLLDMVDYADAIVGVPGDGLNIEQRKRLTIAVELVAKPELLLFLDEPTSGMDSQTAWSICTLLRKLANNGQAILCTIHQPSSQLFSMFDRLLLLNRRGETIYFGDIGPGAITLTNYFEGVGAPKCADGENPAAWVLNATSKVTDRDLNAIVSADSEWADHWRASQQYQDVVQELAVCRRLGNQAQQHDEKKIGEYATPWLHQLKMVATRQFREYWRDPAYIVTKVALCTGMALLNGLSFQDTALDIQGLTNLIFSIFLIAQLFSILNQQITLRFSESINLYESRESRSKSYSWTVFLASNLIVEVVWQTLAAFLAFVVWYFPTGLWRISDSTFSGSERGGLTFFLVWLFFMWAVSLSLALGTAIPQSEVAIQIATLFFWFSLVFCGILIAPVDLPGFWMFMHRVSPLTYFTHGLSLAGLSNAEIHCSDIELLHIELPSSTLESADLRCGEYLAEYIGGAGGYVANPNATSGCEYCPIQYTNKVLDNFRINRDVSPWVNSGYLAVYVVFNIGMIFAFYRLVRAPKIQKTT